MRYSLVGRRVCSKTTYAVGMKANYTVPVRTTVFLMMDPRVRNM